MRISAPAVLAIIGLSASVSSYAVPCGNYTETGGVSPSVSCRDARPNDRFDNARDLNRDSFFGFSDWQRLDHTRDGADPAFWTVSPGGSRLAAGTFLLAPGVWNLYDNIAVVLLGGGSAANSRIRWAAYLLPDGTLGTHEWSYDHHRRLWRLSLYARGAGVSAQSAPPAGSVVEPATLALLVAGLAAVAVARRHATNTA